MLVGIHWQNKKADGGYKKPLAKIKKRLDKNTKQVYNNFRIKKEDIDMRLVTYETTNLTENRSTASYEKAQAWREHGAKIKVVLKEVGTPHPRRK